MTTSPTSATTTVPASSTTLPATDTTVVDTNPGAGATTTTEPLAAPTIDFGPCDSYVRGSSQGPDDTWECGTLTVAMNPGDPSFGTVELAVTRRSAARSRGEALVVNPGGPGGAGLPFAWALADALPLDVQRLFDIVSWDPRGVGSSEPRIDCPRGARWSNPELLGECSDHTGELMAHVATGHHVDDLERLRQALDQPQLNYVGYSYGTFLGAAYAMAHPDHVGRFVLDGAVDPRAGTSSAPTYGGEPWYAIDSTLDVSDRFFELCDLTDLCALGTDSRSAYLDLVESIVELPTEAFPGEAHIDAITLQAVLDSSMYDPFNWGLLATALEDAAGGDASTVDALAELFEVSDAFFGDVVDLRETNEAVANMTIYCADFEGHELLPARCRSIPQNSLRIGPLGEVAVDVPILVLGTEYDPATPDVHAAALADRLGDAVTIHWDGIGHTAFPFNSICIDDLVTGYLLDDVVPEDGTRCEFIAGFEGDAEESDYLFALPPSYVEPWIEDVLDESGIDAAACRAAELATSGDRIVSHLVLGVESPAAVAANDKAGVACAAG